MQGQCWFYHSVRVGTPARESGTGARPVKVRALIIVTIIALITLSIWGCGVAGRESKAVDSCALVLVPHSGEAPIDREIIRLQESARTAHDAESVLEQLGWAYVQKARISYDQGFYKLAEQCAICVESRRSDSKEALLLKGHVLHSVHRFKEAESIARKLTATRAAPFDFALLGDALMEQGRLKQAVDAYQKMLDLKPGPQAYARVAQVRWLKGDLDGAIEMMRKAAATMSPRDAESSAWAYTRLALYELQAGSTRNAERACDAALQLQPAYAPALLARSRVLLAENKNIEAVQLMQPASSSNPLPEYKWLLADTLRAAGRSDEARVVEDELKQNGATEDPRTLALFLATRREQPEIALSLVEQESSSRNDVFTLDAQAWAFASAGRVIEASDSIKRALAEGTRDARLFYHAGAIAAMDGRKQEARLMLNKAAAIKQMLLPSEREGLMRTLADL